MQTVSDNTTQQTGFKSIVFVYENDGVLADEIIKQLSNEPAIANRKISCSKINGSEGIEKGIFSSNEKATTGKECLVVCLSDEFISKPSLALNKLLHKTRTPLLNITANKQEMIAGPYVRFDQTACLACATAQVQYFDFSFKTEKAISVDSADQAQHIAAVVASLWEPDSALNKGGCYLFDGSNWELLSTTLKNPNCPVCSRWSCTPKEVFYS